MKKRSEGQKWVSRKMKRNSYLWVSPKRVKFVPVWYFGDYGQTVKIMEKRKTEFISLAKNGASLPELSNFLGLRPSSAKKRLIKLGFRPVKRGVGNHSGYRELKAALKDPVCSKNGWPDALNIEQKIGTDSLKKDQWCRAAWLLKRYKTDVKIATAKTHLDSVLGKGIVFSSIADFVSSFEINGMLNDWFRLVKIVREKE